jgi:hypothetical protein
LMVKLWSSKQIKIEVCDFRGLPQSFAHHDITEAGKESPCYREEHVKSVYNVDYKDHLFHWTSCMRTIAFRLRACTVHELASMTYREICSLLHQPSS